MVAILIWGATPPVTRIAVIGIDGETVGLLRTILAAVIVIPALLIFRLPRPSGGHQWFALLIAAVPGFVGYPLLFSIGMEHTSTAHAALIIASAPVFTGIIGFWVERHWPRWIWWLGAAVALAGEAVLIGSRSTADEGVVSLQGDLLVLASIICASAGYIAGGRLAQKLGTWAATGWSIGVAGLGLLPLLVSRNDVGTLLLSLEFSLAWLAVLYLAIFTSIIGYAAWYWAIGKAGVARISPTQFLMPLISLALAVAILDESMSSPVIIALTLILTGVFITRFGQRS